MEKAVDFELLDSNKQKTRLSSFWSQGPVLFVFYPGDYTAVCTAQLCDYRDSYEEFRGLGLRIVGISKDAPDKHASFTRTHHFPFPLLSDPSKSVAKAYGCVSKLMLGMVSRAVCIVNSKGEIVWRHVEPFAITRRRASEIKGVVAHLKAQNLL